MFGQLQLYMALVFNTPLNNIVEVR